MPVPGLRPSGRQGWQPCLALAVARCGPGQELARRLGQQGRAGVPACLLCPAGSHSRPGPTTTAALPRLAASSRPGPPGREVGWQHG